MATTDRPEKVTPGRKVATAVLAVLGAFLLSASLGAGSWILTALGVALVGGGVVLYVVSRFSPGSLSLTRRTTVVLEPIGAQSPTDDVPIGANAPAGMANPTAPAASPGPSSPHVIELDLHAPGSRGAGRGGDPRGDWFAGADPAPPREPGTNALPGTGAHDNVAAPSAAGAAELDDLVGIGEPFSPAGTDGAGADAYPALDFYGSVQDAPDPEAPARPDTEPAGSFLPAGQTQEPDATQPDPAAAAPDPLAPAAHNAPDAPGERRPSGADTPADRDSIAGSDTSPGSEASPASVAPADPVPADPDPDPDADADADHGHGHGDGDGGLPSAGPVGSVSHGGDGAGLTASGGPAGRAGGTGRPIPPTTGGPGGAPTPRRRPSPRPRPPADDAELPPSALAAGLATYPLHAEQAATPAEPEPAEAAGIPAPRQRPDAPASSKNSSDPVDWLGTGPEDWADPEPAPPRRPAESAGAQAGAAGTVNGSATRNGRPRPYNRPAPPRILRLIPARPAVAAMPAPDASGSEQISSAYQQVTPPPGAGTGSSEGTAELTVHNLGGAVEFYREQLGLVQVHVGDKQAILRSGEVHLMLNVDRLRRPTPGALIHLMLEVEDVRTAYEALRSRGVNFVHEPRRVSRYHDLELWSAAFRDPDGHGLAVIRWDLPPATA